MTAPALLFLCHTLPYPPDGGVWIRSYHTLRQLSREFEVTALCFERSGSRRHDVDAAVRALERVATTEALPVPQEESSLRKLFDHAASVVTGRVFTYYKHRSRAFRARLSTLLASRSFDLVHVDSLDLSAALPELAGLPVVCGHHNVESELLLRRARAERNPLAKWYVRRQARLQRREEERWCGRVALNVTVSERDRRELRDIAPDARVAVFPNGVDVEWFTPADRSNPEDGVVFVGSAGWFPNRDGMDYFCDEILPRLRDVRGDVPVTWVGGTGDLDRARYEEEHGIRMTGYVEDIRPRVHEAACYVVPLRVGGGTRLKILDAWAMGKAVVSTSQGCEGLDARDGENILIRDSADRFAAAVDRVLTDADLRRRLGRQARETAEETYSWEVIGEDMNETYRQIVVSSDHEEYGRDVPVGG